MFKKLIIIATLLLSANLHTLEFSIGAKQHAAMPLVIGILGKSGPAVEQLVGQLSKDLEFSRQFKVELIRINEDILKKDVLQNIAKKDVPFAIFINGLANQPAQLEWRLYDLLDLKMLVGKKVTYQGAASLAAHMIANKVWQKLMGYEGVFNSVIVACRKGKNQHRNYQHIYAFHPANGTSDKQVLVSADTISFAPRWHPKKKLLYYSQHTAKNVRLMAIDEHGRKVVVTNFEGLNLTPAISPEGQIVVSLSSGGCEKLYRYEFDHILKLNKFIAITDCRMHAMSPSFIGEDQIVFCAIDIGTKLPRITIMDLSKRTATFLTGRAFCVSPAYNAVKKKIAYCKRINGVQQVFCYDLKTKLHEQVTTNAGDKDDCSWSPCGNYLVFTQDLGKESRIALWNMFNSTMTYLSPQGESWCFPTWSPCYENGLFAKC